MYLISLSNLIFMHCCCGELCASFQPHTATMHAYQVTGKKTYLSKLAYLESNANASLWILCRSHICPKSATGRGFCMQTLTGTYSNTELSFWSPQMRISVMERMVSTRRFRLWSVTVVFLVRTWYIYLEMWGQNVCKINFNQQVFHKRHAQKLYHKGGDWQNLQDIKTQLVKFGNVSVKVKNRITCRLYIRA